MQTYFSSYQSSIWFLVNEAEDHMNRQEMFKSTDVTEG